MVLLQSVKSAFRDHRYLIIAALLIPNLLAIAVALSAPKMYEASAWILIGGQRASQPVQAGDEQKAGPEQVLRTQISIALSEEVVRQTIRRFKPEELLLSDNLPDASPEEIEDLIYRKIRPDVFASVEPNTSLAKLSFRSKEPKLAAEFTNRLVAVFLARRAEISSNPGAVEFFQKQEAQYNRDLAAAAAALEEFSKKTGTYSIEEQKRLTLTRRDSLLSALGITQGSVRRGESQAESLRSQILMLKTRITLPPEIFGATNFQADPKANKTNDALWSDPPLLHVKLYQQMAEKLVEANSELAGLRALEAQQKRDLAAIDGQLQELASRETEFQRLQRDVTRASTYIESFRRKSLDARMDTAWLNTEAFSAVQVVQNATVPFEPSSPKVKAILAFGFSIGLLAAAALVYFFGMPRHPEPAAGQSEFEEPLERKAALVRLSRIADGIGPAVLKAGP